MSKRQKKLRKQIQLSNVNSKFKTNQNEYDSSSIVIADEEYIEQASDNSLAMSTAPIKVSTIHVRNRDIIHMEQDSEEEENVDENVQQKVTTEQIKNCQNNQKKSTLATSNQWISQVYRKRENQFIFQDKSQKTQHYYNDGNSEDEQQIQQQQQSPKVKVQKLFVAKSISDLIYSQIPKGGSVCCAITYKHQFLSMKRKYDLYLVNEKKYLFSAKRDRLKMTNIFQFYEQKAKTNFAFGQLRSNFSGLQYVVNKNHKQSKMQLCWIEYKSNFLGLSSQRNMTVLKNANAKLDPIPYFSQIKNYYENGFPDKFEKFTTKAAALNKNGDYQLNFHDKKVIPSAFNFILINSKAQQCLILGRRKQNTFILEISHPFSIFQGFAIAISNLDTKLCVR